MGEDEDDGEVEESIPGGDDCKNACEGENDDCVLEAEHIFLVSVKSSQFALDCLEFFVIFCYC